MPRCSAITREARNELLVARRLALAVEAVVNDRPTGSPAIAMFQAVCTHVLRNEFELLLRGLVATRKITRKGDIYFPRETAQLPGQRWNACCSGSRRQSAFTRTKPPGTATRPPRSTGYTVRCAIRAREALRGDDAMPD